MREYVLTLLVAAAVTYLLTPLVRRLAVRSGAVHVPRDRDVHVVPTPLLGGFAMYGGLAAGLLMASRLPQLDGALMDNNMTKGLLLAGGLIVMMGFIDDRWGMSAISKLAGQIAAGMIVIWSGASVTWLPEPHGGVLGLTPYEATGLTLLVVVMTINAVNFVDGLDGLAAGIVGIGAAAFFIYYYTLTHRLNLTDQTGPALVSAMLAGMCLGFLPHNFHPAKIFMGDTGSMLAGLLLAYVPISNLSSLDPYSLTSHPAYAGGTVNRFGAFLPLLLPAAILLIPYTDLLMAVVRRTRAGMSPFAADRKHLHHRLLYDIGHSHRRSVLILYLWAALFAGSVVWLSIVRTPLPVLAAVTVAGVLALLLASVPRLRFWARSRPLAVTGAPPGTATATVTVAGPAVTGLAATGPAVTGPAAVKPAEPAAPFRLPDSAVPAAPPPWLAAPPPPAPSGAGRPGAPASAPMPAPAGLPRRPAGAFEAPGTSSSPFSRQVRRTDQAGEPPAAGAAGPQATPLWHQRGTAG